ncbi:MAG: putative oxidoreductase, partial [Acidimicrobiales bacterium]
MNSSDTVAITSQALTDLVTEIFEHTSCSDEESRRIADNLVEANLTGHDSHGVVRTGRYVDWLADGVQIADQTLNVLIDEPTLMLVDGQYGMGQTMGPLAVDLGIERAGKHGLSIVALRKSGHLGRI